MFSRHIEIVKDQLETLRKQASELYTIVDGKPQLNQGITEEQVTKIVSKLKKVNDIYDKSLEITMDLNSEIDAGRKQVANTKNKMLALEEYYSEKLGRDVKIIPQFLRDCYEM